MSLELTNEQIASGNGDALHVAAPTRTSPAYRLTEPLLKIRPKSGWAALNLADLWHFRDLLFALALRDVRLRYKQTALGITWVILQPLLAAGVLSFAFGTVAGLNRGENRYFLICYIGMLAWNIFNGTLTRCSTVLIGNSQLISKVFFPRLVLPLSTIPSALLDFFIALAMLVVLMVMYGATPGIAVLMFPVWLAMVLLLSAGIGLWTSALTVSYRDVVYILPVFLQLLLYASPVAYPVSKVPAHLQSIYQLNPLVSVISGMRWSLLSVGAGGSGAETPRWGFVIYSAAVTVAIALSGAFAFKRMERKFADVI